MTSTTALEGLLVVDLAWVVAGPAIGRALADYGATVVRVESRRRLDAARVIGPYLGGKPDPQRCGLYDTYNAGKLGLTLNLSVDAGKEVLWDLVRKADVMVESFAPGQLARWGFDWDRLHEVNPKLVLVSTSLMGQSGPLKSFAGFGNLGAAIAGYQALAGQEGELPIGPFGPYTDYVGPRFGLVALLAALEQRRSTGLGCWLDVSQAEAGVQFLAPAIAQTAATGVIAVANGNRDPQFAPNGVYPCVGDEWVAIVARSDREWARAAETMGVQNDAEPTWRTLAGRKGDEQRLDARVAQWTRSFTAGHVEEVLQRCGVPAHKVASSADLVGDPQLAARGHFVRLPHELGGESVFDASRFQLSETPARYERPAPHFGRDNEFVLADILGYGSEHIARLQEGGVLD